MLTDAYIKIATQVWSLGLMVYLMQLSHLSELQPSIVGE